MRLIDADELFEKTAEWEASAFAYIEELNRTPLEEMDEDEKAEWRRWTAIWGERSAFKHDVADAPTIDPVKHGRWIKAERQGCWSYADVYKQCSECGNVTFLAEKMNYCPNCGADMRGETGC